MTLPMGWVRAQIGDLCDLINGKAFKPSDWKQSGLPIIRIQNLNNPDAEFNYYDGDIDPRFLVSPGELLFAWSGTPGTSFGAHIWNGTKAILNQHIFRVRFDEDEIDKNYFRLAINEKLIELIGNAHGGVGLAHVTKGKFEATQILLPPLAEQRRIVAKLDALTTRLARARAELERVATLARNLRQTAVFSAFRGDLSAEWRVLHPDACPPNDRELDDLYQTANRARRKKPCVEIDWQPELDIPPSWRWISIDRVVSTVQYGSSAKTSTDASGIPVLRMGNIQDGKLDWNDLKYLPHSHSEFPALLLRRGDVLFNRTNSFELVGKSAVFEGERQVSFASYLIRLAAIGILPELLSAYINSPIGRSWIANVASQQVGQANVNGSKLRALAIPLPPQEEQAEIWRKIANTFARADRLEAEAARSRKLLDRLESAILAIAFKGELVPQDPNDEPASALLDRIRAQRAATPARTRGPRKRSTLGARNQ